jgi:ribonuclease P protein component
MKPELKFPKSLRLLSRSQYLAMNGQGFHKLPLEGFLVIIGPNLLDRNRLGITVTKKIGCAVVRNRVKRLVREFFRLNQGKWLCGFDFLFIARKGVDLAGKALPETDQLRILKLLQKLAGLSAQSREN